jgi:hypothetical protein
MLINREQTGMDEELGKEKAGSQTERLLRPSPPRSGEKNSHQGAEGIGRGLLFDTK